MSQKMALKVLVVEDHSVLVVDMADYIRKLLPDAEVATVRWFNDAARLVAEQTFDVVFLDHCMPLDGKGCPDDDDLPSSDLREVGYYGLIPTILEKNSGAVIVGTSSMSGKIRVAQPEMKIKKSDYPEELRRVLGELGLIW